MSVATGRRPAARVGRGVVVLGVVAVVAWGAIIVLQRLRPGVAEGPGFRLELVSRVRTGHQRAERLAFLDNGARLAVACPRYGRVVVYRVEDEARLVPEHDLKVDGRPVALAAWGSRLIVLQRPSGDARHVEEAWWDVFDVDGRAVGSRFRVGFDPDDLVVAPDGRSALVLRSGNAEGESNRPGPSLLAVELGGEGARPLGMAEFDGEGDDPERVAWDAARGVAVVSMRGSRCVVRVDVGDPEHPEVLARTRLPEAIGIPAGLEMHPTGVVRVADGEGGGLWAVGAGVEPRRLAEGVCEAVECGRERGGSLMVGLRGRSGVLEVWDSGKRVGRVWPATFGEFRPMGLAAAPVASGWLVAASDRSGAVVLARLTD